MGFRCQKILFCRPPHYLWLPIFNQVFIVEDRLFLGESVLEFRVRIIIRILRIPKRHLRLRVAKTITIQAVATIGRLIIVDPWYQVIHLMFLIFLGFGSHSLRSRFLFSRCEIRLREDPSRILTS